MLNKQRVVCQEETLGKLSEATLLLDATAFIDAFKSPIFADFLTELNDDGCTFATIPSVLYEFKRGAKDIIQVNNYNQFIKEMKIATISQIESMAQKPDNQLFTTIYNCMASNGRKEKGPSYTDSLLCLALYIYKHANIHLLTTNYKDIPLSLFDRENIIAFDTGRDIRTAAIYKLSEEKLARKLQSFSEVN